MPEQPDLRVSLAHAHTTAERRRILLENLGALIHDLKRVNWKVQASPSGQPGKNPALARYTQILDGRYLELDGLLRMLLAQEDEQLLARYLAEFVDPPVGEGDTS